MDQFYKGLNPQNTHVIVIDILVILRTHFVREASKIEEHRMAISISTLSRLALCAVFSLSAVVNAGEPRKVGDLKMIFMPIPAGQFNMGSPADEPGRKSDEAPITHVIISKDFWMARTEVTQSQWQGLMGTDVLEQMTKAVTDDTVYDIDGKQSMVREYYKFARDYDVKSAYDNRGGEVPMFWVNWNEATEFCKKLTERERATGRLPAGYVYRLPTEAEWEYACRAGTTEATYAGPIKILSRMNAPILDEIAWYGGNSSGGWTGKGALTDTWQDKQYPGGRAVQRDVATKKPNAWGLHDTLGNLWEWCNDWYSPQLPGGDAKDPTGPASALKHVSRGGSWNHVASGSRSAKRFQDEPGARFRCVGFRVALAPDISR